MLVSGIKRTYEVTILFRVTATPNIISDTEGLIEVLESPVTGPKLGR